MHAVNSPWISREIALGLERAAAQPGYQVIPVLVPPLEVPSLRLFFPNEPVALQFDPAREQIEDLLSKLRVALGAALPTDAEPVVRPPAAPVGELVVELDHLALAHEGEQRFAAADGQAELGAARAWKRWRAGRSRCKTPLGPVEAGELKWYLERWPALAERALLAAGGGGREGLGRVGTPALWPRLTCPRPPRFGRPSGGRRPSSSAAFPSMWRPTPRRASATKSGRGAGSGGVVAGPALGAAARR